MYIDTATEKYQKLKSSGQAVILAIESSCDETAAAVVKNGREVLSSHIYTQIELHKKFGGVVPEVASRSHTEKINETAESALQKAGMSFTDIDAIAVTMGAGLNGALLVGLSYAKAAALALSLPLIGVNHIRGHIAANYIADRELKPPFVCLVVSGGHTALLEVTSYCAHRYLGGTVDDAAGEAFDKVARVLGLGYPGGPAIQRAARLGQNNIAFPKIQLKGYDFSYSGLKTAVINYIHNQKQKGGEINVPDVCASFQVAAVDILIEKAVLACRELKQSTLCVAGGVSANEYLREKAGRACAENGIKLCIPPLELCTDNAAMIGAEGYNKLMYGEGISGLELNTAASLRL